MKISTLRIEPHRVRPDTSRKYYRPKEGVILWRIWVDGEKLTDYAFPFHPEESLVELNINIQFPSLSDGTDRISVRYIKDYVLWTIILSRDSVAGKPYFLPKPIIAIFDVMEYQRTCKQVFSRASTKSLKHKITYKYVDYLPKSAAELESEELFELIHQFYPKDFDYTAIYRNPQKDGDDGEKILRRMQYAIKVMTDFTICDPPEKQIELRIGLDEAEFTEAIWHVGKVNGHFAILFEQHPYFPLWLQSEAFDKVLLLEPFAKEL